MSEYVKFLAPNTGFLKVENLEKSLEKLKSQGLELEKSVKSISNEFKTSCNKAEDAKKAVYELNKMLKKLEDRA